MYGSNVRAAGEHVLRERRPPRGRLAAGHPLELLAIGRPVQRLAHADVTKRLDARVHVDPSVCEERLLEAVLLETVGRARLGEALGIQAVAHEIEVTALHHEELDALVDPPSELDLVEVREPLPEVVVEPGERVALALRVVGADLERPVPDRGVCEVGAQPVDLLLRHRCHERLSERVDERDVGLDELDAQGVVVDHLDAGQLLGLSAVELLGSLDRVDVARRPALRLGIEHPLPGVLVVGGDHRAAIVELDVLAERDRVDEAVARHLRHRGCGVRPRRVVGVVGVERREEHVADRLPPRARVGDGRVVAVALDVEGVHDTAATGAAGRRRAGHRARHGRAAA